MHKPLTLLQRLAARAEASDCDCQTDDADLLNEAIAEIEKLKAALAPFADVADFMDAETSGFAMTDTLKLQVSEEDFPAYLVDTFCIQRFYTARAAVYGDAS